MERRGWGGVKIVIDDKEEGMREMGVKMTIEDGEVGMRRSEDRDRRWRGRNER